MGVLLGLLAAMAYGSSDFAAGVASRRYAPGPVTVVVQTVSLIAVGVAVVLFPGAGPSAGALGWGALAGLGSAIGTLALYRGLSVGAMSVTATSSAVLSAVLPAIVGIALGERLCLTVAVGVALTVPAIAAVSWQPHTQPEQHPRAGLGYGIGAGAGFALLLIGLDQAGTTAGAWPMVPESIVALLLVAPFARRTHRASADWRPAALPAIIAGLLGGIASLLLLAATGHSQLTVVAVLTGLYPAITVLLARAFLAERWTRLQAAGLLIAAAAIALTSAGCQLPHDENGISAAARHLVRSTGFDNCSSRSAPANRRLTESASAMNRAATSNDTTLPPGQAPGRAPVMPVSGRVRRPKQ